MPNKPTTFERSRFKGSNSLIFAPPWSDAQIGWWYEHMFAEHGLYPDDLGELLSASVQGQKVITLSEFDVRSDSFVISVKGRPSETGEAWWHQRKLDLKGPVFEAQRMVVPFAEQRRGRGRLLMADLIDTAGRLGIRQVTVEAQDIGRYAWACIGFVPDKASWNYQVRIEGLMRLLRSRQEIDPTTFSAYQDILARDNPLLIREVIRWNLLVNSVQDYDGDGNPAKIPIGKAVLLEALTQWYGVFDLDDPDTMRIFNAYVGRT
jgi:GNAT superfamily N-acetyltransferase